jgi:hypothetical protein
MTGAEIRAHHAEHTIGPNPPPLTSGAEAAGRRTVAPTDPAQPGEPSGTEAA